MDVIDANWIKDRLSGEHGEQARLAEAMGIDSDKLSKILRGQRRVQAKEIPGAISFFEKEDANRWAELFQIMGDLDPDNQKKVQDFAQNLRISQGS